MNSFPPFILANCLVPGDTVRVSVGQLKHIHRSADVIVSKCVSYTAAW